MVLTAVLILLIVGTLAYFLNVISRLVTSISATLGKVAFGVRAVERECMDIGPSADRINQTLTQIASGIDSAGGLAERLAR
ncbi:MAG: hypothetical protein ACRD0M_07500 [Acidimicrobiales bacterium]